MVKLTTELLYQAEQYTNPGKDRELSLRGYKIALIENLGATMDQFDSIDFSDNDIRKIDGFPLFARLRCLLLNNNRVSRIGDQIHECLPNIQDIILTNNSMQELSELDSLVPCKKLRCLCLLRNPVASKRHYRLYVIHKLPQLKLLDFQKVKQRERLAAANLFKTKRGKTILESTRTKKDRVFVPGDPVDPLTETKSAADVARIREAIAAASTLDEVEKLNALLQAGQIPGGKDSKTGAGKSADTEIEKVEEMES